MQRLPLSDPRLAAALMAVGVPQSVFHVEPLHHTATGQKRSSWYVEHGDVASVVELLKQAHTGHRDALWKSDPNHPFLAALAGIENHAALTRWLATPSQIPVPMHVAPGSGIFTLQESTAAALPDFKPIAGIRSVNHAAALIASGFHVHHTIMEGGTFGFAHDCEPPMPPVSVAACIAAADRLADPKALTPPELPGFPPGRHPFFYALSACFNLRLIAGAEASAWKTPVHFFPGPGQRCALLTDAALRRPGMNDTLRRHLAGV